MPSAYQTKFDREYGISSLIQAFGDTQVTQIFAHDVSQLKNLTEVSATVLGVEEYDQRALILARPRDLVCVAREVDDQYLRFLSDLEIGPSKGHVIVGSKGRQETSRKSLLELLISNYEVLLTIGKLVKERDRIELNAFMASPKQFQLAATLEAVTGKRVHVFAGDPAIVDYADAKHNVRAQAVQLGIPVSEGDVVEIELREDGKPLDLTPVLVAIDRHIRRTGRVIIKGSYGASGSSTVIVEANSKSTKEALRKIAERTDNRVYLVEVMLEVIASTNILMHVEPDSGSILCVSVTDQRLSEALVHEGNLYPSRAKTIKAMIGSAWKMSKWLQSEGYCGLVGFDFAEYLNRETGEFQHFLCEINPRINAAAYPKALMEHLNMRQERKGQSRIEVFLSSNLRTSATSFAELNDLCGHLFFNSETGRGVVPYNTGCLEYGKFSLAVFGKSRKGVTEIYGKVKIAARPNGIL
jgi:hypothetical protein